MSDGCPELQIQTFVQQGWTETNIASFMETIAPVELAKTLTIYSSKGINKLYKGRKPIDDATACI